MTPRNQAEGSMVHRAIVEIKAKGHNAFKDLDRWLHVPQALLVAPMLEARNLMAF